MSGSIIKGSIHATLEFVIVGKLLLVMENEKSIKLNDIHSVMKIGWVHVVSYKVKVKESLSLCLVKNWIMKA
jgi:hypothetical protein